MKFNSIFCFATSIFLSSAVFAQNKATWGPDHLIKENPEFFGGFACQDEQGAVLWHTDIQGAVKKTVSVFESYGPDMKLLASAAPPESYNDSETQVFRAFKFGENIYALFLGNYEGRLSLMAWSLDRQTLHTKGEPTLLYDLQKKFSKQNLRYGLTFFQLAFNEDASEMALVFHYDAHQGIRAMIFDRNFKLLWEKEHFADRLMEYTPYGDHKIHFQQGVVALMYSSLMNKAEHSATKQKGWDNHAYHALLFRRKENITQDVWINLGEACFPVSLETFPQANGSIRCVGAYTNQHSQVEFLPDGDDTRPIAGVYEALISTDGKIQSEPVKSPLLPRLKENKASYEHNSKRNYEKHIEIPGFRPIQSLSMPDDGFALIFEYAFLSTETESRVFEDIMVAKLDKAGRLVWANIIPKKQTFKDADLMRYASFGLLQAGDNLHFIYMDAARATAACTWSTIDKNGKLSTKADWLPAEQSSGAMPRYAAANNGTQLVIPALKGKTAKLGLVKL